MELAPESYVAFLRKLFGVNALAEYIGSPAV